MKKKSVWIVGLIAAAGVGIGGFLAGFTVVDGAVFSRRADCFDLRSHDLTPAEYEAIQMEWPEKLILWRVLFQGQHLDVDTQHLKLDTLTAEEAGLLDYLPNLKTVDASDCTDYEALMLLASRRPDCEISYAVRMGSSLYPADSEELTAENADDEQLRSALAALPRVRKVTLTGQLPDVQELLTLKEEFPDIVWDAEILLGGESFPSDVRTLRPAMGTDFAELRRVLPLFWELQYLDLTEMPLTDGQCRELITAFPDLDIQCSLMLGGRRFASDAVTIDLTGVKLTREELRQALTVFRKLKKLRVDGCGLDDETLDELNREFPNTDVVWTVTIGAHKVSTDAVFFYPAKKGGSSVPGHTELQKLRFCHNMVAVDIGHADTTSCDWASQMPHLKYLILADTQIGDISPLAGLKELVYLELFRLPITDYSALLGCTALQDLNIGMTYGNPEPLSKMTWLHNLQWNRGTMDDESWNAVLALSEQLTDTNVMLPETSRNIGSMWRYLPNYYVFRDMIDGDFLNQELAARYWSDDTHTILSCAHSKTRFAGDVLAQIVKRRMETGESIPGIRNPGSEKTQILYETLRTAMP